MLSVVVGVWAAIRTMRGGDVVVDDKTPGDDECAMHVRALRVDTAWGQAIVEDVGFELGLGEILGVVGESGSGKTTLALALLGYTSSGARIVNGEVFVGGERVVGHGAGMATSVRGRVVSYVPQNPGTALNPCTRIRDAITAMVSEHRDRPIADEEVGAALDTVGLPGGPQFQRRFPHQLSGGQQQRVCISIALVCEPPVVVLDEPTTGLDVVTQARILDELLRLRQELGVSMVYVTHDLAVVAQIADRIAVMYAGRLVEHGPAREILRAPRHPYTRGLLMSIPDHVRPPALEVMPGVAVGVGERPSGCAFAPRCPLELPACRAKVPPLSRVRPRHAARCLRPEDVALPVRSVLSLAERSDTAIEPVITVSHLWAEHRSRHETVVAAADVSFIVGKGQCVAMVGESGSGKTTIARAIAGLHPIAAGDIMLGTEILGSLASRRSAEQLRRVQLIFQNPADALNPRERVRTAIARAARRLRGLDRATALNEVDRLLGLVRLPVRLAERYPRELSGGEQQRVAIARALAARPEVIICDEITSALDVSVQAAVHELLHDLRRELGLALIFITHDIGLVASVADEVVVLEMGKICEAGTVATVLSSPRQDYTRALLSSAPSVSRILAEWDSATVLQPSEELT